LKDYVARGEIVCAKLAQPEKSEAEMQHAKLGLGLVLLAGVVVDTIHAQCTLPAASAFRRTNLVTEQSGDLDYPDHMAVLPDGRVFITEMWSGLIKLYTPGAGITEVLPSALTIYTDNRGSNLQGTENGLLGIAADPNFATNNWVYVFYSRVTKGSTAKYSAGDGGISPHEQVLVRYTFASGKLGSPKELLIVPRKTARHSAGGLTFNTATGDLFLTTGDDSYPGADETKWGGRQNDTNKFWLSSLRTAANTNDLRGKSLRIHPLPFPDSETPGIGIGKTYSIPAGNLYPENTAKTRPEIYTMGHRNPYKMKVDPISGVGLIGEVGPDATGTTTDKGSVGFEEFNLIPKPGNYGWPFGIANNIPYIAIAGEPYKAGTVFDMNNLKNTAAGNTGLTDLQPAIGAIGYYSFQGANGVSAPFNDASKSNQGGETAIAGPYYRYDANLASDVKWPAFFHGKFIVSDFSRGKIWSLELDATLGLKKVEVVTSTVKAIDLAMGSKGELYVLEYGNSNGYHGSPNSGKLYKLEYTGTQYAANLCTQYVLTPASIVSVMRETGNIHSNKLVKLGLTNQIKAPVGKTTGLLFNLNGEKVWQGSVQNGQLRLPSDLNLSMAFLQFE
jgi:cytochrome c